MGYSSLGCERPSGLHVEQSPNVQDVFRPIPGLISCAGVTGSVGITRHARATQMAGLRPSQSHSLAAYGSAHLRQLRLPLQSDSYVANLTYSSLYGTAISLSMTMYMYLHKFYPFCVQFLSS